MVTLIMKVLHCFGGLEVMNMPGGGLDSASERKPKACEEGKRYFAEFHVSR